MRLGSLFDGAGTCPLAGMLTGFKPVWASEIAAFPISVTSRRFPRMLHLGDITKLNGSEIEPVDFITFGSPCQDLSVAGKRAGLQGNRSGLFMEAVRIIKEMRGATNGRYPQIVMWENVPGAFSSHGGEDFRIVLEELCKIKRSNTVIPRPSGKENRWRDSGLIMGDGFSIAWRVLDAQFWGVPQRRRRIFLVADFGGQCAGQILFESKGLSRNFSTIRKAWESFSPSAEGSVDRTIYDARGNGEGLISPTLIGNHENRVTDYTAIVVECFRKTGHPRNAQEGQGWEMTDKADTLNVFDSNEQRTPTLIVEAADMYNAELTGDKTMTLTRGRDAHHIPCVINTNDIGIDESGIAQPLVAKEPGAAAVFWNGRNTCSTLTAKNAAGGQRMPDKNNFNCVIQRKRIRRLTPTECARLQGMPGHWCDDVPHKDTPEYEMWGNGMAFPCVLFVFEGVRKVLLERIE